MKLRRPKRLLLIPVLVLAALALPASAMAVISAPNNGMTHNAQYIRTLNNAAKPVRDMRGTQLVGSNGPMVAGSKNANCPVVNGDRKVCVRVQPIEAIGTQAGQTLYYQWPFSGGGEQGFVAGSDLATTPSLNQATANGNGATLSPYPGRPRYVITPQPIDQSQGYWSYNEGVAHTFAPYGWASAYGGNYTLLSWNLTTAAYGGGIARAAVSGGESFYAASDPVTITTYGVVYNPATQTYSMPLDSSGNGIQNGSATFVYGYVWNGVRFTFGWLMTSHYSVATGQCVDHVRFISGAAPVPNAECARNSSVVGDFTGDQKADAMIANGNLNVMPSSGSAFGSVQYWRPQFGGSSEAGFRYLSGDFTGDGKEDALRYDMNTGGWTVAPSTGSAFGTPTSWLTGFGTGGQQTGYQPLVEDFNGDGKSDIGVYEPDSGNWYFAFSNGTAFVNPSLIQSNWGASGNTYGYKTMAADMNSDGKGDVIIFDPNNGYWSVGLFNGFGFSLSVWQTNWGGGGPEHNYKPLVGDFNGDGRSDVGIYDPNNGYWSVGINNGGWFSLAIWFGPWGQNGNSPGYRPLTADFNGDGKTDVGIFDPTNDHWSVALSTGSSFSQPTIWR